ncbi:MAG: LysE family transporter [Gammaproteobacteria bacterium]|nr:LysE family transporter [Gammaproteobacteria bacterium]
MTLAAALSLLVAMAVLAAVPSVSVMAVSARAAAFGFSHGLAATLGIVVGDLVFIVFAIFGLALLAGLMGELFFLVRIAGGVYLLMLAVSLWRAVAHHDGAEPPLEATWLSSFMAGLLVTLADQKAIVFYLGFFPAFLDLARLTLVDALLVMLLAIVAVGGVKLIYALAASRLRVFAGGTMLRLINRAAAAVLMLAGLWLLFRGWAAI